MYSRASGHNPAAIKAATAEMAPSITTGTPQLMPPRNAPVMPAISKPPSFESTSRGSFGSGRLTIRARSTAPCLRRRPSSDSPAPRFTVSSGESPNNAQHSAALAVVFPMPISPVSTSR